MQKNKGVQAPLYVCVVRGAAFAIVLILLLELLCSSLVLKGKITEENMKIASDAVCVISAAIGGMAAALWSGKKLLICGAGAGLAAAAVTCVLSLTFAGELNPDTAKTAAALLFGGMLGAVLAAFLCKNRKR